MSSERVSQVCIVYPADPLGTIPGGIDTFIRGILRWVPDDIEICLVGVTTEPGKRPVNRWTTCQIGNRTFNFYPILSIKHSEKQSFVPVTLRFLFALMVRKPSIPADVLEFHRIEPALRFLRSSSRRTLVLHQNMEVLRDAGSDIRWRHFPKLYFMLEDYLLPRFSSVYCVREDATDAYKSRFPKMSERIRFTPTWVDVEVFHPPTERNDEDRARMRSEFDFPDNSFVLVTVGRLDRQKNPMLLIDSFHRIHKAMPDARLLLVGDGVLRTQIEERVREYDLTTAVHLCGVKGPSDVSRYLRTADAFVLTSAYEGMPMCVLEALGSGLPVVTTDVGEVRRVVKPGSNGEISSEHTADAITEKIVRCRSNIEAYRGKPCIDAVRDYTPQKVLAPVYQNYRDLSAQSDGQ